MIRHISAQCPNRALHDALYALGHFGLSEDSRNGGVVVYPHPVITTYTHPRNRVLSGAARDANPFFHLFEAMWMLAGRNDLAFPQTFVSTFSKFSDDGVTLHGAYGYRWREYFGYDQLSEIIQELKANPKTRRAVLSMWDGGAADGEVGGDLGVASQGGKDVPCNTHAYFDTIGGKLNMTVLCRSNDAILGAYGANVVHFSVLLEYMSLMTEIPMGVYRQFSNNLHVYEEQVPRDRFYRYADDVLDQSVYATRSTMKSLTYDVPTRHIPLIASVEDDIRFHRDIAAFCDAAVSDGEFTPHSEFFKFVVNPMYVAWRNWKNKDYDAADTAARMIVPDDWRKASGIWLLTRAANRKQKEA